MTTAWSNVCLGNHGKNQGKLAGHSLEGAAASLEQHKEQRMGGAAIQVFFTTINWLWVRSSVSLSQEFLCLWCFLLAIFSAHTITFLPSPTGVLPWSQRSAFIPIFLSDTENQELSFGSGSTCSLPIRGERNYSPKTTYKIPQEAWKNALLGSVHYFDFLCADTHWMVRQSVHHSACCPLCTNLMLDWHFCVKTLLDSHVP